MTQTGKTDESRGFEDPEYWNFMYDEGTAPWLIGGPQPAIAELEAAGLIRGRVLEPGCGSGEHTILFTKLGYESLGVDLSPSAIAYARRTAAERGVPTARFEVANMLHPEQHPFLAGGFDTIVDVALFHGFGAYGDPRAAKDYADVLHSLTNPGALVHILAHSDAAAGLSSSISDDVIRATFTEGWEIESIEPAHYQGFITGQISEVAVRRGLPAHGHVELAAWLARVRRL
ncbi:Methyltransferase domain-containing protein [Lentzea waywayandensis]|uniref:Methyltransferase domain-containing protein n=1 Tax=Lentzea waywayandensis TaxID=84724 RepID=A0A1I6DDX0_9PSEU|nr:class I SAM-dependent methyltransferase [Lentzea waywayandensis]SFR03649.1 Methyltransferase domain-containing protein [Lentzea waywayandensis]